MIKIDVKMDIDRALQKLRDVAENQVPYATSKAINATAKLVRKAVAAGSKSMSATAFSTSENALFITPSNKRDLNAVVGYKEIQARYMAWQIGGGKRVAKGFELKLRGMGILPSGYVTVPGIGIKLDNYGNISQKTLATIFGMLSSGSRVYAGKGKRMRGEVLFVVKPGDSDNRTKHLKPGIYQRIERSGRSKITPLIMFVSSANYIARKFFDFHGIAKKTVADEFPAQFRAAIAEAMRTAR